MVPFAVSALVVFALQPSVEFLYELLVGLVPPHRWFGCCCLRRKKSSEWMRGLYGSCFFSHGRSGSARESPLGTPRNRDEEALRELEPLLEKVPTMAVVIGEAVGRFLAVAVSLSFIFLLSTLFFMLLGKGALHMKDNWNVYKDGLRRIQKFQDRLVDVASKEMGLEATVDEHMRAAYDRVLAEAEKFVWVLMNELIRSVSEGVTRFFVVLLYVMFWLMQPLPTGGKVSSVVRSYLWKKSMVSTLYGTCVTVLFAWLKVDLAILFGVVSFFLNFVPEVGAFISMLVPVPIILLDGRHSNPLVVLLVAMLGQLMLKFLIGNILEVKLIERDKEMNIHPVWIILGLSYFGYVWGPMGALLSVPMMAMVKTTALSVRGDMMDESSVVPALAESFLACFEGRHTCWARPNKEPCASWVCAVQPGKDLPDRQRAPSPLSMPPPPKSPRSP